MLTSIRNVKFYKNALEYIVYHRCFCYFFNGRVPERNSDFLIGRKFPQLSFFRPIREPHTMTSDRDSLYQVINTTSTVAIFFLSLSLSGSQNSQTYHAVKIWVAKGPARCKIQPILPRRFCYVGAIICTCVKSKCLIKTPSKSRLDYCKGRYCN